MDELVGILMRLVAILYGFAVATFLLLTGVTGGTATFTGYESALLGGFVGVGVVLLATYKSG